MKCWTSLVVVVVVVGLQILDNSSQVTAFAPVPSFRPKAIPIGTSKSIFSAVDSNTNNSPDEVAQNEEEYILLDLDEDDESDDARTYTDFYDSLRTVMGAKKRKPSVVVEAQAIFDDMYDAYIRSEENPSLWPNVTIYNLLLDAHAWSPTPNGGLHAEHILNRMEDLTIETIARPDIMSYMHVMEGWANRKAPEKAQAIMDRLIRRYEQTASANVKPDAKAYNKLIGAWMKSSDDDTNNAEQAERILQDMIQQFETTGDEDILPNQKSFTLVMRSYGNRKTEAALDKVRELFDSMKKLYLLTGNDKVQPDTQVYNELIDSIAQNKEIQNGAQQAEAILYEMMEAVNMGNDALQPNAATFRHIIYGYKGNPSPGVAYKVEKLLELPNSVGVEVNVGTYNAAIQVIAWTREPEKGALCWKLLQRMKKNGLEPTKASYNNVLNACANTLEPKDPKELFRIAIEAYNELRDNPYMRPDVTTYGHLLRCCSELLPKNSKRDSIVRNIFKKCCSDGQVGRFVLTELMSAGSEDLVVELLGGPPDSGVKIPRKWSESVKDSRQLLR